jgi:lipopolysaccharide/colanic/teichoic acid biosynthesis glycosyltransferase
VTRRYLVRALLAAGDLGALLAATWLGWITRFRLLPPLLPDMVHVEQPWSLFWPLIVPSAVLLLIFAAREGLYQFGHDDRRRQLYGGLRAVAGLSIVVVAYLVAFRLNFEFSRLGTVLAMGWLALLLPALRLGLLRLVDRRGWLRVPAVLIGPPARVDALLESVGTARWEGRNRTLARIEPSELLDGTGEGFRPEADARIDRLIRDEGLEKAVLFMEGLHRRQLATILRKFEIRLRTVMLIPDAASLALMGARILRVDGQPLLSMGQQLWSPGPRLLKRLVDLGGGLLALPLVLLTVLLASPFLRFRPLMRVRRFDLTGRPFHLWQLRVDYEAGGLLFQSGLYKLPELLGVLSGRQSLVGPAPLIEREFELYRHAARALADLRPGLTGLWQVSDYGYFEPDQRLALDLYYAMNSSLGLDLRILFESLLKGLRSLRHPRQGALRT